MTSLVPISPIAHHLNFGGNKMADEPVAEVEEVLLLKAEIFRSKLIEHFQLLDALTNTNLEEEIPKYHSDEVRGRKCTCLYINSKQREWFYI